MSMVNNEWRTLLTGLDTSDTSAVARRRQETDEHMVCIVARILRRGTSASALERRVLATARLLAWQYPSQARDSDWLAREVAGSVSREVLADGPAPLGGQALFDTVCA
jgi:hypothetical protein